MTVGDIVADHQAMIIGEVVDANGATAQIQKALIRYEVMETIFRQIVRVMTGGKKVATAHLQHEVERLKTGMEKRRNRIETE